MENRPVVDLKYLPPLDQQVAFIQLTAAETPAQCVQVFYLIMMVGQVMLVRDCIDQHSRAHLRSLQPRLGIGFGLLASRCVVIQGPRLMQLRPQFHAEVSARIRVVHQDGGSFVGASRKRIGGLVDDVFRDRCWLDEVDEVADIATQESITREPRVVVFVAAVYCELQLCTCAEQRICFVTVRAIPYHVRCPQGENHRHFAAVTTGIWLQRPADPAEAIGCQCAPGGVLVLNDDGRCETATYHNVRFLQPVVLKRTLGFLLHMPA